MDYNTKKWYQSKTVWFNIAIILVDVINQLGQFIPIPVGILTATASLGNLLLRFKTTQGIE